MSLSPLSRFAVPLTIVAGALVIVTRLVIMLTVPAEIEPLKAYVLTTTHAVNSIAFHRGLRVARGCPRGGL